MEVYLGEVRVESDCLFNLLYLYTRMMPFELGSIHLKAFVVVRR